MTVTPLEFATTTLARAHGQNIIAVASGKGGVGKTWFSIMLAGFLAKQKKSVLLFDGDLGLANIDIQLGLNPKTDLTTTLSGKIPFNQIITHYEKGGFDVIAGRSGSGALAGLPLGKIQMLKDDLMLLSAHYDSVIIDLGSGLNETVELLASTAGKIVVLCTDEPTALTDAYAFIKVISNAHPEIKMQIIINSAASEKEGKRTYETILRACQTFLHLEPELLGIIKRDTHVKDSIRAQTPTYLMYPDCSAVSDVAQIAQNLNTEDTAD